MKNTSQLPSCLKDDYKKVYMFLYILGLITFIIVGAMYEQEKLPQNDFEKESIWWHGLIVILIVIVLFILVNIIQRYIKVNYKKYYSALIERYFWSLSHVLFYFTLTYVSPGQWPFWVALGITWEFIECYTICWKKYNLPIKCSGYYDLTMNFVGVATAMWIKHQEQSAKII